MKEIDGEAIRITHHQLSAPVDFGDT